MTNFLATFKGKKVQDYKDNTFISKTKGGYSGLNEKCVLYTRKQTLIGTQSHHSLFTTLPRFPQELISYNLTASLN